MLDSKSLYFLHEAIVAQLVRGAQLCAWNARCCFRSTLASIKFFRTHWTIEPVRPGWAGLVRKPAVRPRFDRFIPVWWRDRSSALKEPAKAPVPVFSGWTGGPVWFFKLCLPEGMKTKTKNTYRNNRSCWTSGKLLLRVQNSCKNRTCKHQKHY